MREMNMGHLGFLRTDSEESQAPSFSRTIQATQGYTPSVAIQLVFPTSDPERTV